ncbi:MAG TPA: site-2 protease family protein [Acidimicrobiales bacterium]|nr:site-2 protease family protein [Acidimicrobiales bacterium]
MEPNPDTRRSLLFLLAGIVVFVGLLTWIVGWALPLVIFAIIFIVMFHEFGHFITAKRAGMKVTDFFVGFGPVLWSTTIGETRYGVRAILAGGYVKVPGMTWTETIPEDEEARTYRSASYPRKVLFASAGSLMHVVMALALAWAALTFVGLPSSSHVGVYDFTKWQGHSENAAQLAGMKAGDQIVAINGVAISSDSQLQRIVSQDSGRRIAIEVQRNGRTLTLHATPVYGPTLTVNGKPLAARGYLGVSLENLSVRDSWFVAIPGSVTEVGSLLGTAVHAIVHVFSPGEFSSLFQQVASPTAATNPKNQLTRPESIVGVVRIAVQSTSTGPGDLLLILMAVNIFVGVLNMLPMLPLDGGYVAIATYERLRSRRGIRYHADVNKMAPIIYAFMGVLLILFATTLFLDIAHPIANPFH